MSAGPGGGSGASGGDGACAGGGGACVSGSAQGRWRRGRSAVSAGSCGSRTAAVAVAVGRNVGGDVGGGSTRR